jgi:hypothetical protein
LIRFHFDGWIRIRIQEVKMIHKKEEVLLCFEELDVLFCLLEASPVAWTSFMEF